MGKVVHFRGSSHKRAKIPPTAVHRRERASKSLENSLLKILLSLSCAGMPEMALDALIRWGEGVGQPSELLENVQSMAAVSGIRLPVPSEEGAMPEWHPS